MAKNIYNIGKELFITNDEEIKFDDYITDGYKVWQWKDDSSLLGRKKVILSTDQDLIAEGIQQIDDEFLEWFVKNPSCESVEVKKEYITPLGDIVETCYDNERLNYSITIPKEEPDYTALLQPVGTRQETLEEVDERLKGKELFKESNDRARKILSEIKSLPIQETLEEYFLGKMKEVLLFGNDAQAIRFMEKYFEAKKEISYSEEIIDILDNVRYWETCPNKYKVIIVEWFEQFKKK